MRLLAFALTAVLLTAADPPALRIHSVASGFEFPLDIRFDGTGRMFVVEQRGVIRVVKNGSVLPRFFVDVRARVSCCDERGLLGMALAPDFQTTGVFYINYTDRGGNTVVSRMRAENPTSDAAAAGSEQVILQVGQPYSNHNGGNLAFGRDGYLYVGLGDGGSGGDPQNYAQRNDQLLGKMLRIDVKGQTTYTSPSTNPFVSRSGYRPEIWATGLRNPWRYSFDRETGDLWIADVGQSRAEEVNIQPASSQGGENYGWNRMEGLQCYPILAACDRTGLTLPVLEYGRSLGQSVTGGFVYRGSRYPALRGFYLYSDFGSGNLWALQRDGANWDNRLALATELSVSTFGEDAEGELYLASFRGASRGEVFAIVSAPSVSAEGVVNAASFAPGISPGSLATVFGKGITSLPGIIQPGSFPITTDVGGISITLNGVRAPVLAVAAVNGQEQINFQVPYELAGSSSASIVISANGFSTAPMNVPIVEAQPEIFTITRTSASTAIIWATGLGAVTNTPLTGAAAAATPLSEVSRPVVVTVGGATATVGFAGLAPTFAGLYQINVTLPAEATTGAPVILSTGGATGKAVALP